MTNFITKAAAAVAIALGTLGTGAAANAAQIDVIIQPPRVVHRPVVIVRPAPVVVAPRNRCSPDLALYKARSNGLTRVAVTYVSPNRIIVSGRTRGMNADMRFYNVAGCPRV